MSPDRRCGWEGRGSHPSPIPARLWATDVRGPPTCCFLGCGGVFFLTEQSSSQMNSSPCWVPFLVPNAPVPVLGSAVCVMESCFSNAWRSSGGRWAGIFATLFFFLIYCTQTPTPGYVCVSVCLWFLSLALPLSTYPPLYLM